MSDIPEPSFFPVYSEKKYLRKRKRKKKSLNPGRIWTCYPGILLFLCVNTLKVVSGLEMSAISGDAILGARCYPWRDSNDCSLSNFGKETLHSTRCLSEIRRNDTYIIETQQPVDLNILIFIACCCTDYSSFSCIFIRALWLNIPCLFVVITVCALDGMVIFATYARCDLKEQGKITRGDQVKLSPA